MPGRTGKRARKPGRCIKCGGPIKGDFLRTRKGDEHFAEPCVKMKDRRGRDAQTGISAVVECERIVLPDGSVRINGRRYTGEVLLALVGKKVNLHVGDCYALEYSVRDAETQRRLGDVKDRD